MAIKFLCPNPRCGRALKVRDELAGMTRPCPGCGITVVIPAAEPLIEVEVIPIDELPEPAGPAPRRGPVPPPPPSAVGPMSSPPTPTSTAGGNAAGPLRAAGTVALVLHVVSVFLPWHTVSLKGDGPLGAGMQSGGSVVGITLAAGVAGLVLALASLAFVAWAWLGRRELLPLATRVAAGASLVAFFLALGQMFRGNSAMSGGGLADVFKLAIEVKSGVGIYLALGASIAAAALFGLGGFVFSDGLRPGAADASPAGTQPPAPDTIPTRIPTGAWIGSGAGLAVLAAGVGVGYWLMRPGIHLENLPRVRAGMTLAEVESLIGPGELVSTTGSPSGSGGKTSAIKTIRWRGEKDGFEQEIELSFADDRAMIGFGPRTDSPKGMGTPDLRAQTEELRKKLGESSEARSMPASAGAPTTHRGGTAPGTVSPWDFGSKPGKQRAVDGGMTPAIGGTPRAIPDVDGALAALTRGGLDQLHALDWLIATSPVDTRRDQVSRALAPLVNGQREPAHLKAVEALAVWSGPAQLDLLIAVLDQPDAVVRRVALSALGRLRDARAASAIAQRLLVPADREDASRALKAIGAAAAPDVQPLLSSQDRAVRTQAVEVLRSFGALNADAVRITALADLRDHELAVRVRALQELAQLTPAPDDPHRAETAAILGVLVKDSHASIRVEAARALAAWAVADNVTALIEALGASNGDLRRAAMEALGRLREKRAVHLIARHLLDGGDREQATRSLQMFGPAAENEALRYLQHRDAAVRAAACRVLETAGSRRSIVPLRHVAGTDRSREAARAAARAIEEIEQRKTAR